jgi:Mrp family chromosome partitioning ATPase
MLIVGHSMSRAQPVETMRALGFECSESDDPYSAMAELAAKPESYSGLVLSLAGLYREELAIIRTVKHRFNHIDVWLTQTDGRQAALAEAMRLGADGLLAEDGLHRSIAVASGLSAAAKSESETAHGENEAMPTSAKVTLADGDSVEQSRSTDADFDTHLGDPVLSAEELRALLDDHPDSPADPAESHQSEE